MILSDKDNDYETDDIDDVTTSPVDPATMCHMGRRGWLLQLCTFKIPEKGDCDDDDLYPDDADEHLDYADLDFEELRLPTGLNHAKVLWCEAHPIITLTECYWMQEAGRSSS